MLNESKVTKKGQITIPKEIRNKLGIKVGDKLIFESITQGILLRKKESSNVNKILEETAGIWRDHPLFKDKDTKEIIEFLRGPDDEQK
jgi:AbrB family looped-hinge helix DNA binding protein